MASLAKSGYEDLADTLATLIEDKDQSDVVKLYAVQGLGNLLGVSDPEEPNRTIVRSTSRNPPTRPTSPITRAAAAKPTGAAARRPRTTISIRSRSRTPACPIT